MFFFCFPFFSCNNNKKEVDKIQETTDTLSHEKCITQFDTTYKTIHIYVSLCDNKYQEIVPVPAKIGNGQDPDNNLYWGCKYGVRSYFMANKEWKLLETYKLDSVRLERLIFKHKFYKYYLVADAYNGKYIKRCTSEFLSSTSGQLKETIQVNNTIIGIAGNSKMVAYIGHNGLMDFEIIKTFKNTDGIKRDIIILACYSKQYFSKHLKQSNVNPLLLTTGLMSPEAYTIDAVIRGYINNEACDKIRSEAALAYSKYQNCSVKAAKNLLVTGW